MRLTGDGVRNESNLYPSAQMESKANYLYGYFEIRAKVPAAYLGPWASLYLWKSWSLDNPEIDVYEYVNGPYYYWGSWSGVPRIKEGGYINTGDITTAYHTFAVRWQVDEVRFYFDGVDVAVATTQIPQEALNMFIMNLTGGFGGPPTPAEAFPSVHDVDYVKVWQVAA